MSNNLWLDARGVAAGTADLKASGDDLKSKFTELAAATSRINDLAAAKPAGTDETGTEFDKTHQELLAGFIEQGKQVADVIKGLGLDAEQALVFFTKTDLESADDLKLD
ncbi:hypothetical protein [Actinoplanes sp. GCM10030250]|uniref:hypothetical protein n=1 Tax=Actinoplanes sp. GCM10030250 TaxID=3273376 RepID=UPI00360C3D73